MQSSLILCWKFLCRTGLGSNKPLMLKMGHFRPLWTYFWPFFKQTLQLLQQNVHPVSGAGNRTHDLLITSLLPWPLDRAPALNEPLLLRRYHFFSVPRSPWRRTSPLRSGPSCGRAPNATSSTTTASSSHGRTSRSLLSSRGCPPSTRSWLSCRWLVSTYLPYVGR